MFDFSESFFREIRLKITICETLCLRKFMPLKYIKKDIHGRFHHIVAGNDSLNSTRAFYVLIYWDEIQKTKEFWRQGC